MSFLYAVLDCSIPQTLNESFSFQWSLIFKSVPSSSKWPLSFRLQLLKPLSVYALHRLFQTPRPFSSAAFHQPDIDCSAAQIKKLPVL